jgi:hypothetical protein
MAAKPQLSSVNGKAYGIVFGTSQDLRDWDGPFSTGDEAQAALDAEGALDPDDGLIVEWSQRQQQLARTMDHHGIHPNVDYQYDELMEALAGERECPRYGAISADETYVIVRLAATPEEAAELLADAVNTGTLDEPVGVVDLDTGQMARPNVSVAVTLSPFES